MKVLFITALILALGVVNCFIPLPSEPKLPTTVCATLSALLTSSDIDHSENQSDTSRIVNALKACPAGQALKLIANSTHDAFLSAPFSLPSGVTLWIDKGVTLFASSNPSDYSGFKALIMATNTVKSGVVGDGIIDGRGGSKLTGRNESWWDLGLKAKETGTGTSNPRLIEADGGSDFTLYRITLHNGPKFHVVASKLNGFIAWGVKLQTPTKAYPSWNAGNAKNTDGIDPSASTNVIIAYCHIDTGDDNVAIKSSSGKTENVTIAHNHFYAGHGMSIGSETNGGVVNVLVTNLTLDGTDNGLRIKSDASKGGAVRQIRYERVCMRSVNNPLEFNAYYSNDTGSLYPDYQDITVSGVHILSSGKRVSMFRGYDEKYPLKIRLDNVQSDVPIDKITESHAEITVGPGIVKNIDFKATADVKVIGTGEAVSPIECSFPSFGN